MKKTTTAVDIPASSILSRDLASAYFYDCYQTPFVWDNQSALALYLSVVQRTPAWVNALMKIRNLVVSLCGLKNLGLLSNIDPNKAAEDYVVGDKVGIFTLQHMSTSEVVLCDADKHLRAQISICKTLIDNQPSVAVSTVVHVHNTLGKAYLLLVVPVHKFIVPAMLRQLAIS
jgi:Protein of unknown function (DUF2867)